MTPLPQFPRPQARHVKLTPGNWIALIGLILTVVGAFAAVSLSTFYGRAEGKALEVQVGDHCTLDDRRHVRSEKEIEAIKEAGEKRQEMLHRVDKNTALLGERWKVRGIEKAGEP